METILEITFSSFWHFIGVLILVSLPFQFVWICLQRIVRGININKNGWPPEHCDADGDFASTETDDEE